MKNDEKYLGQYKYKNMYLEILRTGNTYDYTLNDSIDFDYSYNKDYIDNFQKK